MADLTREDIGELHIAAAAALGSFPRVQIDPEHAVALCDLARRALDQEADARLGAFVRSIFTNEDGELQFDPEFTGHDADVVRAIAAALRAEENDR